MATGEELVQRLCRAVGDHDLENIVECFAPDYRNDTPAHTGRGFIGRDQVRTNWRRILEGVPDITAEVLRTATAGDEVWSEWEMRGTRRDGGRHLMRGVVIFGVADPARFEWARFYLDSVDAGEGGVDAAVGAIVEPLR